MNILTPPRFGVAFVTGRTQLPHVYILRAMTGITGRAELLCGEIGRVATITLQIRMRTRQHKFCVARMIKIRWLPATAIMTLATILSHPACMRILRPVTAVTILGNRILHASTTVATGAIGL